MSPMELPAESSQLLEYLSVHVYEEPLRTRWADRRQLPAVARNVVLLLDLDVELQMNGLAGLIENSVGEFLPEMISGLEDVGASRTAAALRTAQQIMARHGITHAMLRADGAGVQVHEITSFQQLHGDAAAAMLDELESSVSPTLYLYRQDGEDLMQLLDSYVALHLGQLRDYVAKALSSPR